MSADILTMTDAEFRSAVLKQLDEVKRLLGTPKQEPVKATIPLEEFCKRLNRTRWWGYEMIKRHKIVPAKTGKPYEVPVEQLQNFLPGRAAK